MSFIIGVLTFILVLNCLLIILLVLVQLPKKDAGAGMAFGGGTADALFGAGSGNALTKITKYATITLLVLSFGLGHLKDNAFRATNGSDFSRLVDQKQKQKPGAPAPAPNQAPPTTTPPAGSPAPVVPSTPPGNQTPQPQTPAPAPATPPANPTGH